MAWSWTSKHSGIRTGHAMTVCLLVTAGDPASASSRHLPRACIACAEIKNTRRPNQRQTLCDMRFIKTFRPLLGQFLALGMIIDVGLSLSLSQTTSTRDVGMHTPCHQHSPFLPSGNENTRWFAIIEGVLPPLSAIY